MLFMLYLPEQMINIDIYVLISSTLLANGIMGPAVLLNMGVFDLLCDIRLSLLLFLIMNNKSDS